MNWGYLGNFWVRAFVAAIFGSLGLWLMASSGYCATCCTSPLAGAFPRYQLGLFMVIAGLVVMALPPMLDWWDER